MLPATAATLALAAPLLLSACAPEDENAFAPSCAPVGILAEAADYTDYGPNPPPVPDLGRIVSHGSIAAVSGHCSSAKNGHALRTAIGVRMLVDRGPAARGSTIRIPWFVAVVRDNQVLRKEVGEAEAQFPDNGDMVSVNAEPLEVMLPVSREQPGTS
ncbi:MAG: hypothetical protein INR65_15170, partial [Gluconacetobacter diazotrophicus]|nr:hypothetical protein [Gluconacetobacter diazotrophicus]